MQNVIVIDVLAIQVLEGVVISGLYLCIQGVSI